MKQTDEHENEVMAKAFANYMGLVDCLCVIYEIFVIHATVHAPHCEPDLVHIAVLVQRPNLLVGMAVHLVQWPNRPLLHCYTLYIVYTCSTCNKAAP